MPEPAGPTQVVFDSAWLEGSHPGDWHRLVRNLLTPADDPARSDSTSRLCPFRCCEVVDLQGRLQRLPIEQAGRADAILLPILHARQYHSDQGSAPFERACRQADQLSRRTGLPVLVQGNTADMEDSGQDLQLPLGNLIYLNQAIVRAGSSPHVLAHTYPIPDYLEKYCGGELEPLTAADGPSVSFWGVCPPFAQRWSRTRLWDLGRYAITWLEPLGLDSERIARRLGTNIKHAHRSRAVRSVAVCPRLRSDIQLRPMGGLVDGSYWKEDEQSPYRRGFYESIHRHLYSICSRGTENYSIRFYETLCLGRIPVVIDTDIRLPFDDRIDYHRHCLILPKAEAGRAAHHILEHHRRHTPEQLRQLQQDNRSFWQSHLSPGGFYQQLGPVLRSFRRAGEPPA